MSVDSASAQGSTKMELKNEPEVDLQAQFSALEIKLRDEILHLFQTEKMKLESMLHFVSAGANHFISVDTLFTAVETATSTGEVYVEHKSEKRAGSEASVQRKRSTKKNTAVLVDEEQGPQLPTPVPHAFTSANSVW